MAREYLFHCSVFRVLSNIYCISFSFSDIYQNIIVKCVSAWSQAKVLNPLKKVVMPIRPEVMLHCGLRSAYFMLNIHFDRYISI